MNFLATRLNSDNARLDFFGTHDLAQVYRNRVLVGETTDASIVVVCEENDRIDVLDVPSNEAGIDHSDQIDDDHGDKAAVDVPDDISGHVKIYGDAGTGIVDYGRLLGDVEFVGTGIPSGWGHFAWGHARWGHGGTPRRIFVSARQRNGTAKIALLPVERVGVRRSPTILTATIQSRPDQVHPRIVSYDPVSDVLTLSVS